MNSESQVQNENANEWIPLSEAAKFTPYSADYLSLLARKRRLTAKKIDGIWYTTRAILTNYLAQQVKRAEVLNQNSENYLPFIESSESVQDEEPIVSVSDLEVSKDGTLSPQTLPVVTPRPIFLPEENVAPQKSASGDILMEEFMRRFNAQIDRQVDAQHGWLFKLSRFVRRSFRYTLWSAKFPLFVISLVIIVVLPLRFVSGFADNFFQGTIDAVKNAQTVMGFRPGTHENEILLLGPKGEIAIFGNVETEGQFRSYVEDGIAPITVKSTTKVDNLNADMLDGTSAHEFTLAYVTKNGNITYEPVFLEGTVEVGQTLMVKGATKLLDSLRVDGNLSVFGAANFAKGITVSGPAVFKNLITAPTLIVSDLLRAHRLVVEDDLTVEGAISATSGRIRGNFYVEDTFRADANVSLGSDGHTVRITSEEWSVDNDGNAFFEDLTARGDTTLQALSVGGSANFSGPISIAGALNDASGSAGTLGYILQSTGTSTQWVATSSLGIVGGGGSGITSLNGQTGVTQTFATGTATGIGLTVTSSGDVHTFTPTVSAGYSIPLTASTTEWSLAYASSTALTPAYMRGLFSNTATGLTYDSASGITSLTSGYTIPLTASTTEWSNFYNTPSTRITAGDNLAWSGNTLVGTFGTSSARASISETVTGLDYDSATGILSSTSGYSIPLTASTTEWSLAYASSTSLTPSYIRGLFSNTATGLTYNSSTGATSLTSGYIIPLSASTTEWTNFYNTPSTRITAGNGLAWTGNSIGIDGPVSVANGGTGATSLTGVLLGNGTSAFTATTSLSSSYIEDAYVRNTGDTMTGNLVMGGTAANIALGSNWLSGDGDDEGIFIGALGHVGIGTSSPAFRLDIVQSSNDYGIRTSDGTTEAVVGISSTNTGLFGTRSNNDTQFITNNTIRATIASNGNFGIGDTSPASLLSVGAGDAFQVSATGTVTSGTWNGNDIDISDFTNLSVGNGITLTDDVLTVTAAGGLAQTIGGLTTTGVLEDLNTLGAPSADGEFIVATGAGTFAYESGATARTSLGLGTIATQNANNVAITGGTAELSAATTTDLVVTGGITTSLSDGCVEVAGGVLTSLGASCGTGSGGLTSLNGLTASSQSFATSTSGGIRLNITSSGGVHTFTAGLTSGYTIPLTASTTEWTNFYNTPSTRITAGDNLAWSGNTLVGTFGTSSARASISETVTGIDYSSLTGVLSLTSGYVIPLSASTTEWSDFYNTPSTRITAGDGVSWTSNTLNLDINELTEESGFTSGDYLAFYDATAGAIRKVNFDNLPGAGGGLTSLNGLSVASQTFATSSSGGLTLTITSTSSIHTFTPGVASGYTVPLTASTTEWSDFYNTPSTRITAGDGLSWSTNTLNLDINELTTEGTFETGDYLAFYDATAGGVRKVAYSNLPGAGGSLTSLNGLTAATQTFATSSDTNIGINVVSSGSTHTFTPTWTGTLAVARGGTGAATLTGLVVGNGTSAMTATTTSAGLAGVISDETGSGALVFGTSPIFTTNATFFGDTISDFTGVGLTLSSGALTVATSTLGLDTNFFQQNGNSFGTTATLGTNDANSLAFETSGTARMTIATSGYVGIGTTTPARIFHISTIGQSTGAVPRLEAPTGYDTKFEFWTQGTEYWEFGNDSSANNTFVIADGDVGSNARLVVLQGGNVGIGTTTPGSLLTVAGTAEVTGAATLRSTLNVTGNTTLTNASTTNFSASGTANITGATALGSTLNVTGNTTLSNASSTNLTVSTNSYLGTVRSGTWNGSTIGETYGGTGQTTYATGDILYASGSNTLAKRTIGSSGNVLVVSGGVPTWTATSSLGLGASFFQQNGNSFGTTATLGTNDANTLAFETSGTARMTILSTGNVGIGDDTPASLFTVGAGDAFQVNSSGVVLAGSWNGSDIDISDYTNLSVSNGITLTGDVLSVTAAGGLAQTTGGLTTTGVLEDLNTLGAPSADGEFIVATGAGTFAYESGATVRTSLGLVAGGAGDIWVEKAGDTMTGGLTMSGSAANIALGSNYLSGDGGDEGIYVSSTGNVGIGTSSPDTTRFLTVERSSGTNTGVAIFRSTLTNAAADVVIVDADNAANRAALQIQGNGGATEVAFFGSNGNVGIGTSSPAAPLHLYGTSAAMQIIERNSATAGAWSRYDRNGTVLGYVGYESTAGGGLWTGGLGDSFGIRASGALHLTSGATVTSGITVATTGRVGIGTTSPSARLHVLSTTEQLRLAYDGSSYWTDTVSATGDRTIAGNGTGGSLNIDLYGGATGDFSVNSDDFYVDTSSGNVGVGTTTPIWNLAVEASSGATTMGIQRTSYRFANLYAGTVYTGINFDSAGYFAIGPSASHSGTTNTSLVVGGNGNVGIGTTSPAKTFSVAGGSVSSDPVALLSVSNGDSSITFEQTAESSAWTIGLEDGHVGSQESFVIGRGWQLDTDAKFTITTGGNVGIGTTTPHSALAVTGTTWKQIELGVTGSPAYSFFNTDGTSSAIWDINRRTSDGAFVDTSRTHSRIIMSSTNGDGYIAFNSTDTNNTLASERMRIDGSGNVGIGTTTPGAKLQVLSTTEQLRLAYSSSVYWTDTIASDGGRSIVGRGTDADLDISFASATDGDFSINTNDLFVDTSSGNVGVGTVSPDTNLTVHKTSASAVPTLGTASGSFSMLGDTGLYGLYAGVASSGNTWFQAMRNNSATAYDLLLNPVGGEVGIGLSAPEHPLHIYQAATTATSAISMLALEVSDDGVDTNAGMGAGINFYIPDSTGGGGAGNSHLAGQIATVMEVSNDADGSGAITFSTAVNALSLVEAMRITSGSKVGIGDTAPNQLLGLLGTNAQTSIEESDTEFLRMGVGETAETSVIGWDDADALHLGLYSGPTDTTIDSKMVITSAGNVGIGTVSPDQMLHVYGNITAASTANTATSTRNSGLQLWTDEAFGMELLYSGGWRTALYTRSTDGDIAFGTYAAGQTAQSAFTELMTIEGSSGNVGIGDSTPDALLDVAGTGQFDTSVTVGTGVGTLFGDDNLIEPAAASAFLNVKGGSGRAKISLSNDVVGIVSGNSSGYIAFYNDGTSSTNSGTEAMRITGGNVGIGTTTPAAKLQVLSTTEQLRLSYSSSVYWTDTIASDGGRSIVGRGTDADLDISFASATDGDFSINTNDLFVDTSTSRVGINITNPGATLQVVGDSTAGSGTTMIMDVYGDQSVANTGTYMGIQTDPTYSGSSGATLAALTGIQSNPRNTSSGIVTNMRAVYAIPQNSSTGTTSSMFGVTSSPQNTSTGAVTSMYGVYANPGNTSSGNVTTMYGFLAQPRQSGAGGTVTNMYGAYLDCGASNATGSVTTCYGLRVAAPTLTGTVGNVYSIWVDDNDIVLDQDGTGTLGGTTGSTLFIGEGQDLELYHDGTNSYIMNNTGDLYIGDAATDDVILSANGGKVGIGTTTPEATLTIAGGTATDTAGSGQILQFSSSAGTPLFGFRMDSGNTHLILDKAWGGWSSTPALAINRNTGNFGIGTTTPAAKLNVLSTTEQLRLAYSSSVYWTDTIASDGGRTMTGFGTDGDLDIVFTGATDGDFSINTDDLFVDTSAGGLVGLGTASPAAKLTVNEASNATKTTFTQAVASAGILINTNYTANNYTPGIFWNTSDNNATKPKAGIFLQETASGSFMYLGTSNAYATGITNDGIIINPSGGVTLTNASTTNLTVSGNSYLSTTNITGATTLGSTLTVTGVITANEDIDLGASDQIDFADEVGDKAYWYSNTYGTGIESSTLTNWSSVNHRWRIGGSSVSAGTQYMLLNNTGLTVTGSVDASVQFLGQAADTVSAPSFSWTGDTNVGMYRPATDTIGLVTNGAERLRVTSTGNVGIGTTTPNAKLTITGQISAETSGVHYLGRYADGGSVALELGNGRTASGHAYIDLIGDTTYTDYGLRIQRSNGGADTDSNIHHRGAGNLSIGAIDTGNIVFRTGGTDKVIITNAGNVGIGTSSPSSVLHVANATPVITLQDSNGATTAATPYLEYKDSAGTRLGYVGYGSGSTSILGIVNSQSADIGFYTADTQRMTITSGGNVGIGTSSPENISGWTKVLDVYGAGNSKSIVTTSVIRGGMYAHNSGFFSAPAGMIMGANSNHPLSFITNGASRMTINTSGNVGIGTTTPSQVLTVIGSIDASVQFLGQASDTVSAPSFSWTGDTDTGMYRSSADVIGFTFGGTQALQMRYWDSTSNADLAALHNGVTDAGILLQAAANANFTIGLRENGTDDAFEIVSGGGNWNSDSTYDTAILTARANGNVGIGNAVPTYMLHVGSTSVADATVLFRIQDSNSSCFYDANTAGGGCVSDMTLKKDIENINGSLGIITALRPVYYRWKSDSESDPLMSGFLAQEVEAVLPHLVSEHIWQDGSVKKILHTGAMMPYVVGAVIDMNTSLEELLVTGSTTASSTFAFLNDSAKETIWSRMVKLAESFKDGVLELTSAKIEYVKADKVETRELCVGSVCVDEGTFLKMVQMSGGAAYALEQDPPTSGGSGGDDDNTNATSTDPVSEPDEPASGDETPDVNGGTETSGGEEVVDEVVEEPATEDEEPAAEPTPEPSPAEPTV